MSEPETTNEAEDFTDELSDDALDRTEGANQGCGCPVWCHSGPCH
jgi:hypothetical protein